MSQIPKPPPFNPLDKRQLGDSLADALLECGVSDLPPEPFVGAGVYAIYYTGPSEWYTRVAACNGNGQYRMPIYIGKAVPHGARKGGRGLDADPGLVLQQRLRQHAESINQVESLQLADFVCRYLVVDDIWIPLAESVLIQRFQPLWNVKVDGFGNHDPGTRRKNQYRSQWDGLHPGRTWAAKLGPPDPALLEAAKLRLAEYNAGVPEECVELLPNAPPRSDDA
jgi:hypothetical protein